MVECCRATDETPQTFVICLRCPIPSQKALLAGLRIAAEGLIIHTGCPNAGFVDVGDCVVEDGVHERFDGLDDKLEAL